jgi:hypothetical protein
MEVKPSPVDPTVRVTDWLRGLVPGGGADGRGATGGSPGRDAIGGQLARQKLPATAILNLQALPHFDIIGLRGYQQGIVLLEKNWLL